VLEASCESTDDVGILVGWLRDEVKEWVERTVTVIETNQLAPAQVRDGRAVAAWVLLRMGAADSSWAVEQALVASPAPVPGVSQVSAVFGEYDYVVRLGADTYQDTIAAVGAIRRTLGRHLAGTVTLLEAKSPVTRTA
jgi:hypothetical protein